MFYDLYIPLWLLVHALNYVNKLVKTISFMPSARLHKNPLHMLNDLFH
jgi:hypothetical protein